MGLIQRISLKGQRENCVSNLQRIRKSLFIQGDWYTLKVFIIYICFISVKGHPCMIGFVGIIGNGDKDNANYKHKVKV